MNTATKVLHQHYATVKPLSWAGLANTPYQWTIQGFLLLVLLSALATVMATSKTRHDYRELQTYQQQRGAAELQRGRLLLEQSTLLTQARVVQVAGNQSAMAMPTQKMLVVVTK
ncbi:MAG: cell division protein FtsL [Pseudomonadota bacterium]